MKGRLHVVRWRKTFFGSVALPTRFEDLRRVTFVNEVAMLQVGCHVLM